MRHRQQSQEKIRELNTAFSTEWQSFSLYHLASWLDICQSICILIIQMCLTRHNTKQWRDRRRKKQRKSNNGKEENSILITFCCIHDKYGTVKGCAKDSYNGLTECRNTKASGMYETGELNEHPKGIFGHTLFGAMLKLIKMNSPICQRYVHQHFLCKVVYLMEWFVVMMVPDTERSNLTRDTN